MRMDELISTTSSGISTGVASSNNSESRGGGGGIRRQPQQSSEIINSQINSETIRRRLMGYCGWKIWNTNSGKTCDQVAVELVATNSDGTILQVAQAKSQILTEGCVCDEGEKSFDDDVITPMAFCGECRYKDAFFSCDDRVEFVMNTYPEDNPTLSIAKMNLLKKGDCIDRNWTPYALKVQLNDSGGGLSGGAIAGIVIAALALCCASIVGCCILRDSKKVNSDGGEDGKEMQGAAEASANEPKPKLNVIEEGDEGEEEESVMGAEMSVSLSVGDSALQSKDSDGMADDETEIITNIGKKGNEK